MKRNVLIRIAEKLSHYDRFPSSDFYVGAFEALSTLLTDFGYTYVCVDNEYRIIDSNMRVVCTSSKTTWKR